MTAGEMPDTGIIITTTEQSSSGTPKAAH